MEIVICIVLCLVTGGGGFFVGWVMCDKKHKAQRGQILSKTIMVAREIVYAEMASPEFHQAVMAVVHPDELPMAGYGSTAIQRESYQPVIKPESPEGGPERFFPFDMGVKPRQFQGRRR